MTDLKETLDTVKNFLLEKDYFSLYEFLNDFLSENFNEIKDKRNFIRDNLACCETRIKGYESGENQDVILDLIKLKNYIGNSSLIKKSFSTPEEVEKENQPNVSDRFESWSEE